MPYQNPQESNLFKKLSVPSEIHLRKDKVIPAIQILESYIKDATNAGMKEIRGNHGRRNHRKLHKAQDGGMEQIHPTPDPVGTGPYARLLTERAKTGEVAEGRDSG